AGDLEVHVAEGVLRTEDVGVSPERGGYVEADIAFHRALLDAGGNRLLGSLGRAVEIALQHSFDISTQTPGAAEASLPGHRAVVRAVEARDPDAAAAAVLRIIEAAQQEIARSPGRPDGTDGTDGHTP
ncbi:FadR/GntR family transcriptional regulator, partial [Streptomyces werraensis]|uniref:FadR/GntR family transcriptional regulator n=1 Tax=Streptomyces werraensis TaxID=68284 RepID=UPI0034207BCE